MSLPVVCVPPVLNSLIREYRKFFTKPQFKHFNRFITGLIVSKNKTIEEINDAFGKCDQSCLNRFVSHSTWELASLNKLRIKQIRKKIPLKKKGIIIIDESMLHKTGRQMELAGIHRSGITKRLEWGHMIVNSLYVDTDDNEFPVDIGVYVREKDCEKYNHHEFKTKREMAIEQIDLALQEKLNIGLVIVDAGYEGEKFTQEIQRRNLDFCIGVRTSTKISIDRQKRISIGDYLITLTDADFKMLIEKKKAYFYHIKKANIRGIGRVKLIISYKHGDEKNIKCYITNLKKKDKTIIKLLVKRWHIECFHRDAKQHLGLEAYQVRKARGMQVVALAILIAYTLVILAGRSIKTPLRPLKTIGEKCRYFALIAYKGVLWFRRKIQNQFEFIDILKKLVFVKIKNAKV